MANILLGWELGAGLGHLTRLAPVARHLHERGHAVTVASRNLKPVYDVFGNSVERVCQAPYHPAGRDSGGILPTLGFIHILNNIGFDDPDGLRALTDAWRVLYDVTQPALAIVDHSPTAILASHLARIPCMTIGNGFEHPNPDEPLPAIWPSLDAAQRAAIAASERDVLANVNVLLERDALEPFESMSELYAIPRESLLATLPVLDHYGARDVYEYYGIARSTGGVDPEWPDVDGPKLYAYLKPSPRLEATFEGLTALGLNMLVYQNNLPQDMMDRVACDRLRFTGQRLDLDAVAARADIALTNATHATLGQLLLGGLPCAMAPLHPEQRLLAYRIEEYGAGVVVDYRDENHVIGGVRHMLEHGKYRNGARRFADEHAGLDLEAMNGRMYERIDAVLGECAS